MCLVLPGLIEWIGEGSVGSIPGRISFGERTRDVNLVMVPNALVGDHVIVHSGYAIRIVDGEEAARILELVDLPTSVESESHDRALFANSNARRRQRRPPVVGSGSDGQTTRDQEGME